jgi:sensor histidine kinase YesM
MDYRKKISDFVLKHRYLQHLLFWLVIIITYIPYGMLDNDSIEVVLVMSLCLHIPQILASYFIAYGVIPQFVYRKRYVYAILLSLFALYFFPMLARLLTVHVGEELVRKRPFEQESVTEILTDIGYLFVYYVPAVYTVSFQFLFVKYFFDYKRTKDKQMLLNKEKAEAELKMLKSQLNPHFLFNTLNNIYSLSLDNSPKTPLAIGKLSEILDHVLYQCNDELVSLSNEVNLIRNYIELEKLRYDERLEISITTNIENDVQIPPLILLSLVENAFKHGAGEDSGSPKIWIDITSDDHHFKAEIGNTISDNYVGNEAQRIGLSNIRMQLDLIYADRYAMQTQVSEKIFKVILEINPQ